MGTIPLISLVLETFMACPIFWTFQQWPPISIMFCLSCIVLFFNLCPALSCIMILLLYLGLLSITCTPSSSHIFIHAPKLCRNVLSPQPPFICNLVSICVSVCSLICRMSGFVKKFPLFILLDIFSNFIQLWLHTS